MKTLDTMTEEERSLLLFLETQATDHGGCVKTIHMNKDDMGIAKQWNQEGFIKFGRICSRDLSSFGSNWCLLSDEAWQLVHAERRARALLMWAKRTWKTTDEMKG